MKTRRLKGLEQIARVCMTEPDDIVNWHQQAGFPLRRQGKVYVCTDREIEAWARSRRQAERRHRA